MYHRYPYSTSRPLVTLLLFCSLGMDVFGQENDPNNKAATTEFPKVEWIKSWPSADSRQPPQKFRNRFISIVFGTKIPRLSNPVAVCAVSPDDFWVLDQANKTVFRVEKGVGDITHPLLKPNLDLSSLVGICQGPGDSRLFTDSHAQKIYRISPESKKLQYLNDSLTLEQPTGIAYSALKKEFWVVETKSHCISVLDENGKRIKRIGHRGSATGEFNYPTHIWIDAKGIVYITDAMNFRIQVLNPDGEVISVFGEAGDASGFIARPKGVATDSFGNIYVVDALFNVVQVFDIKGNFLYKFGNQGHGNGEFWIPSGIFIDAEDYIYVADTYNSRVQIFKLTHSPGK